MNSKNMLTWKDLLLNTPVEINKKTNKEICPNFIHDNIIYKNTFYGKHPHLRKFFNIESRNDYNKTFTDEELEQIVWNLGNINIGIQENKRVNRNFYALLRSFERRIKIIDHILKGIKRSGFNVNADAIYFINEDTEYKRKYYITSSKNKVTISNKDFFFSSWVVNAIINKKVILDNKTLDIVKKNISNKEIQSVDTINQFLTDNNIIDFFKVCVNNIEQLYVRKSIKDCILECNYSNVVQLGCIIDDVLGKHKTKVNTQKEKVKTETKVKNETKVKEVVINNNKTGFLSKLMNFFSVNN